MMLEGAGFEVIDLGINNPVEKYLAALEQHKPDILGMSALLTTTMPYMKVVIDTLKERGIRNDYIVLVGGAPLNEEFGKAVGADAYCRDAAIAVETAKRLLAARRAGARRGVPRARPEGDERRMEHAPGTLIIACGALAREIAALQARQRLGRARRALPAGRAAQPARAHSRRRARADPRASRAATRASSSPTATAAPAARSMRCSREEGVERIPGAHCYEFFATAAGVRRSWPRPSRAPST